MSDEEATQTIYLYTGEALRNIDKEPTEIHCEQGFLEEIHAGVHQAWQCFLGIIEFENEPTHPREPSD